MCDNFRRYIKENLFSGKESLQGRVMECYVKKKAVDSLTSPSSSIHSSSVFPETLSITDDRTQYSKGGLTHITDSADKFFKLTADCSQHGPFASVYPVTKT